MGIVREKGLIGDSETGGPRQKPLQRHPFLSRMGHDLRTSIMGIIGYSEMLIEDLEEGDFAECLPDLRKIHAAGNQLLGFVNDLFDPKKTGMQAALDMDQLRARIKNVTLAPITVIEECAETLLDEMEQRHAEQFIPDLPVVLTATERFVSTVNDF